MARAYFYFLATYSHNYERLCNIQGLNLPASRFIFLADNSEVIQPVVAQFKLTGAIPLWNMYSRLFGRIKSKFKHCLPQISSQLASLVEGPGKDYLDFNPENWMFVKSEGRIYYVDLEPTFVIGRDANDHNLYGLNRFFI